MAYQTSPHADSTEELSYCELTRVQVARACQHSALALIATTIAMPLMIGRVQNLWAGCMGLHTVFASWLLVCVFFHMGTFWHYSRQGLPQFGISHGFCFMLCYNIVGVAVGYGALQYGQDIIGHENDMYSLMMVLVGVCFVEQSVGTAVGVSVAWALHWVEHCVGPLHEYCVVPLREYCVVPEFQWLSDDDAEATQPHGAGATHQVMETNLAATLWGCLRAIAIGCGIGCLVAILQGIALLTIRTRTLTDLLLPTSWATSQMFSGIVLPLIFKQAMLLVMGRVTAFIGSEGLESLSYDQIYVLLCAEFSAKCAGYFCDKTRDMLIVLFGQMVTELLLRIGQIAWRSHLATPLDVLATRLRAVLRCHAVSSHDDPVIGERGGGTALEKQNLSRNSRSIFTASVCNKVHEEQPLPRLLEVRGTCVKDSPRKKRNSALEDDLTRVACGLDAHGPKDSLESSVVNRRRRKTLMPADVASHEIFTEDIRGACEYAAHMGTAAARWHAGTARSAELFYVLLIGVLLEVATDVLASLIEKSNGIAGVGCYRMPRTGPVILALCFFTSMYLVICIMVHVGPF